MEPTAQHASDWVEVSHHSSVDLLWEPQLFRLRGRWQRLLQEAVQRQTGWNLGWRPGDLFPFRFHQRSNLCQRRLRAMMVKEPFHEADPECLYAILCGNWLKISHFKFYPKKKKKLLPYGEKSDINSLIKIHIIQQKKTDRDGMQWRWKSRIQAGCTSYVLLIHRNQFWPETRSAIVRPPGRTVTLKHRRRRGHTPLRASCEGPTCCQTSSSWRGGSSSRKDPWKFPHLGSAVRRILD